YCPANTLGRNVETWWPFESGTIAGTYSYPFWMNKQFWFIPKQDYSCAWEDDAGYRREKLTSDRVLLTDYLGCTLDFEGKIHVVAWNHEQLPDSSPRGMNMCFGDGHVEWRKSENRWQMWGFSFESIYWFWAKPN